jgi:hypothetical protein
MGGTQTNIAKQYLSVAAARDKERGFTDDTNDLQATSVDVYSVRSFTCIVFQFFLIISGFFLAMVQVRINSPCSPLLLLIFASQIRIL